MVISCLLCNNFVEDEAELKKWLPVRIRDGIHIIEGYICPKCQQYILHMLNEE